MATNHIYITASSSLCWFLSKGVCDGAGICPQSPRSIIMLPFILCLDIHLWISLVIRVGHFTPACMSWACWDGFFKNISILLLAAVYTAVVQQDQCWLVPLNNTVTATDCTLNFPLGFGKVLYKNFYFFFPFYKYWYNCLEMQNIFTSKWSRIFSFSSFNRVEVGIWIEKRHFNKHLETIYFGVMA